MNPIAIVAIIGAGIVGLSMLARKTNAVQRWLEQYFGGQVQLPRGFALSGRKAAAVFDTNRDGDVDVIPFSELAHEYDSETATAGELAAVFNAPGTVHALADGVVSLFAERQGGTFVGLSHLDTYGESSLYFFSGSAEYLGDSFQEAVQKGNRYFSTTEGSATVGLGQLVHAGDEIVRVFGSARVNVFLQDMLVPNAQYASDGLGQHSLDIRAWLSRYGIQAVA